MELETLLRILIRKWRIIASIFIVTFLATVIFTITQPPIYEAKATFVTKLSRRVNNSRDFATVINILSSRIEIATTYAEIASSRRLKAIAGQKLNLSPQDLRNLSVSSRLVPGANIIEVTARGPNPTQVRDFANIVGASTVEYVQDLYTTFTLDLLDEAITPRSPTQPKVALNLILGAVLGLVLGSGIALLTHFFQTAPKELEKSSDAEAMPLMANADDLSIIHVRHDVLALREEFESIKHLLKQIQLSTRKNNSYAKEIRSAVYDLEEHLTGKYSGDEEVKQEQTPSRHNGKPG